MKLGTCALCNFNLIPQDDDEEYSVQRCPKCLKYYFRINDENINYALDIDDDNDSTSYIDSNDKLDIELSTSSTILKL